MKVIVTYTTTMRFQNELDLIEGACKMEGIECFRAYYGSPIFNKYYKGGRPAVVINDEETVVYGFWKFCAYMLEKGTFRV